MRRALWLVLGVMSAALLAISWHAIQAERQNKNHAIETFHALREQVAAAPAAPDGLPQPEEVYGALAAQNPDFAGWIAIDGTPVDYPVMQTVDYYYLNRGFDKAYSVYGLPFADPACDLSPRGTSSIVYAHNMKDGEMFAALQRYKDPAYLAAHPLIRFDTLHAFGYYRVAAVLKMSATVGDPKSFDLSRYARLDDAKVFDAFQERCAALSLYPTETAPAFGDKLLVLSTCEYSAENGRMVIVAKRLPEDEILSLRQGAV